MALNSAYFRFSDFAQFWDHKLSLFFPAQIKSFFREHIKWNIWKRYLHLHLRQQGASNTTGAKSRNCRKYGQIFINPKKRMNRYIQLIAILVNPTKLCLASKVLFLLTCCMVFFPDRKWRQKRHYCSESGKYTFFPEPVDLRCRT